MAGQVKHKQIFSSIRPDRELVKVLLSLGTRNTDSLIGAVAKVLEDEGIHLISSTLYLEPLLARGWECSHAASRMRPSRRTSSMAAKVARHLAKYDIGQPVVIAQAACVALEAMEGTDATIIRAGELMKSAAVDGDETLSRKLTVVKVAKPNQDMRFDVPVIGLKNN